ncbi:MAG TPA: SMC-Scp complex subunit ScpB [Pyrinomonadaceae bacterium]|nr:SMC-Scp complex subunit ScpB [Pyrinomonadaceae bacterium]
MSKRNGKNKSDEAREAAVAELDEAMDSLGGGEGEGAPENIEESSAHPSWATLVDPAGASADEDAEYAEAVDEDDDDDEDDEEEEGDLVIFDADAEDRAEEFARAQAEAAAASLAAATEAVEDDGVAPGGRPRELAELVAICEALIFVSDEPITTKTLAEVLKEDKGWVQVAVEELAKEFNDRNGGLMLREVAGGWQFATRAEHHEHVRAYLKSKPSAKLSLAALETLAVIAYRQPVTVPEILEIRGVQSSSAIKTLLDKRLIIAKGRKETVGRPMMYGTSKEFLLQFGLRDLGELPNVEDFEDLTGGGGE